MEGRSGLAVGCRLGLGWEAKVLVGGLTVGRVCSSLRNSGGGRRAPAAPYPYHSGVGAPVWRKGWADCLGPPLTWL